MELYCTQMYKIKRLALLIIPPRKGNSQTDEPKRRSSVCKSYVTKAQHGRKLKLSVISSGATVATETIENYI